MALLKDIAYKVSLTSVKGDTGVEVTAIHFDSRRVVPGCLFVAVRGTQVDGHAYIPKALEAGASAIVCEEMPEDTPAGITFLQVADSAQALGILASNFYGNPSAKLKLVGVTGTNGKTTTVTLLWDLFRRLGYRVGLLSTVVNRIDDQEVSATHTTPDAISLNALLAQMVEAGCTHAFMEVSSHALVQHRTSGLQFTGGVFTNISHDHLDYHGTFDEYIKAKKLLFDQLPKRAFALVNVDDKRGRIMLQNSKAEHNTFALKGMADFKAKLLSNSFQGLQMEVGGRDVWFQLVGGFNAYNLLGIYAASVLLGEEEEEVLTQMSTLGTAPGRFETVRNPVGITALVDYAHTPDALENVLKTIEDVRTGNEQVITVVGCGGNRDRAKRPKMAAIACELSNRVILTSDNPRDEEPMAIIEEMQAGVPVSHVRKTLTQVDRREAIKTAVSFAQPGDIILVTGKGHETYQEIKGVRT
ncbi:MAG: UDP-N-acetylmuramoyl-L-alanyl-D-glutamate--2,6-diaminopimelate ligase, partial [Bacteroidota bacterium]